MKTIINDYRDVWVLSYFEQFDVFGHSWIIIVESEEIFGREKGWYERIPYGKISRSA